MKHPPITRHVTGRSIIHHFLVVMMTMRMMMMILASTVRFRQGVGSREKTIKHAIL